MATTHSLQAQINQLRSEIARRDAEIDSLNASLEAQIQSQYDALRNSAAIRIKQIREGFESEFTSASDRMEREHAESVRKLEKKYYELIRQRDELLAEMAKKQREQAEELRLLQRDLKDKEEREKRSCQAERGEFLDAQKETRKLPHKVFCPGKESLYSGVGVEGEGFMNGGEYVLAGSLFASGKLGYQTLSVDVRQQMNLIQKQIALYEADLEGVEKAVHDDEIRKIVYGKKILSMSEPETDYWSDGTLGILFRDLAEHREFLERIKADPYGDWLIEAQSSGGSAVECLLQRENRLRAITKQCVAIIQYAFVAMLSFERMFEVRGTVSKILQDNNFTYVGTKFGRAQERESDGYREMREKYLRKERCTEYGGEPDYREERVFCYERDLNVGTVDTCTIRITPKRDREKVSEAITFDVRADYAQAQIAEDFANILSTRGIPVELQEGLQGTAKRNKMTMAAINQIAGIRMTETNS